MKPRPSGAQQRVSAWARVYPTTKRTRAKSLRRGAWYPVVNNELPDRVSLQMGTKAVAVPRSILEIRQFRPEHFSVVNRAEYQDAPNRKSVYNLGKVYAVCPACSQRLALWGEPQTKACTKCGHKGDVGWWEA